MKLKKIVVADLIEPTIRTTKIEESILLRARICRKKVDGYLDLKTNTLYSKEYKLGIRRVKNVIPISEYYYTNIGIRKRNNHDNKQKVYENIKYLRRQGKI